MATSNGAGDECISGFCNVLISRGTGWPAIAEPSGHPRLETLRHVDARLAPLIADTAGPQRRLVVLDRGIDTSTARRCT